MHRLSLSHPSLPRPFCLSPTPLSLTCLPVCLTCLSRRVDDLACLSVSHPSLTHLYIRLPVCLTCLSRRADDRVYRLSLSHPSLPRPFCPSPTPLSLSPVCHLYIRLPVCLTCLSRRVDDLACLSVCLPPLSHSPVYLSTCVSHLFVAACR